MKTITTILLTTFSAVMLLLAASIPAHAVPAKGGVVTVVTADGYKLDIILEGDEFFHYNVTPDGYLLIERDGNYFYGDVDRQGCFVSSGIKAVNAPQRTAKAKEFLKSVDMDRVREAIVRYSRMSPLRPVAGTDNPFLLPRSPKAMAADFGKPVDRGLFPGSNFPTTGEPHVLVLLVQYTDVKFSVADPQDYYTRQLNEPGFSDDGATGSVADYFQASSRGIFRPKFDVYGPITLSENMSFYGRNDSKYKFDINPHLMSIEACIQLDPSVDFSIYDCNGDGYIDNAYVIYAGLAEASGGSPETVWPHASYVSARSSVPYIFDGVRLERYACSSEMGSSGLDGIGSFCHEFGHVLGLPDVYSVTYTDAFTPYYWDVMDRGSYLNNSHTPASHSAFERYALGWIEPTEIVGYVEGKLAPIASGQAYIINTTRPGEYFLLENRQKEGWDSYIPSHGMLVWHIDYDNDVFAKNECNINPSHQHIDIIEADNILDDETVAGDPFPGSQNVRELTADSTPALLMWDGSSPGCRITDITETPDRFITFCTGGKLMKLHTDL